MGRGSEVNRGVWLAVVAVMAPVLGCGGLVTGAVVAESSCQRKVEAARQVVRADTAPIRAELAPLQPFVRVDWVLSPNRDCSALPVPGTERDTQEGVVRVDAATGEGLLRRYGGWQPHPHAEIPWSDARAVLSPYMSSSEGPWLRSDELDAQFTGEPGEYARYFVDVEHSLVWFTSYADHGPHT